MHDIVGSCASAIGAGDKLRQKLIAMSVDAATANKVRTTSYLLIAVCQHWQTVSHRPRRASLAWAMGLLSAITTGASPVETGPHRQWRASAKAIKALTLAAAAKEVSATSRRRVTEAAAAWDMAVRRLAHMLAPINAMLTARQAARPPAGWPSDDDWWGAARASAANNGGRLIIDQPSLIRNWPAHAHRSGNTLQFSVHLPVVSGAAWKTWLWSNHIIFHNGSAGLLPLRVAAKHDILATRGNETTSWRLREFARCHRTTEGRVCSQRVVLSANKSCLFALFSADERGIDARCDIRTLPSDIRVDVAQTGKHVFRIWTRDAITAKGACGNTSFPIPLAKGIFFMDVLPQCSLQLGNAVIRNVHRETSTPAHIAGLRWTLAHITRAVHPARDDLPRLIKALEDAGELLPEATPSAIRTEHRSWASRVLDDAKTLVAALALGAAAVMALLVLTWITVICVGHCIKRGD
jgi:hypothetical protein